MRPARVIIGVGLVVASACARTDWIDRTLVTVDVTGVWDGTVAGTGGVGVYSAPIELVFQQNGPKVTGELKGGFLSGPKAIPIEGTVSGDTFSFHGVDRGQKFDVVLQVKGDEMTGKGQRNMMFTMTLRRRQ